jgi:hypothetical protein
LTGAELMTLMENTKRLADIMNQSASLLQVMGAKILAANNVDTFTSSVPVTMTPLAKALTTHKSSNQSPSSSESSPTPLTQRMPSFPGAAIASPKSDVIPGEVPAVETFRSGYQPSDDTSVINTFRTVDHTLSEDDEETHSMLMDARSVATTTPRNKRSASNASGNASTASSVRGHISPLMRKYGGEYLDQDDGEETKAGGGGSTSPASAPSSHGTPKNGKSNRSLATNASKRSGFSRIRDTDEQQQALSATMALDPLSETGEANWMDTESLFWAPSAPQLQQKSPWKSSSAAAGTRKSVSRPKWLSNIGNVDRPGSRASVNRSSVNRWSGRFKPRSRNDSDNNSPQDNNEYSC